MDMEFEVLAEGLQFPEGPVAMPDGSVILVELARGTLSRVWNKQIEVIAHLGGSPNGAALGPDGAMYVTNSGGFGFRNVNGLMLPSFTPADYKTGRIERVDLATGAFERVYDAVNGNRLSGPNDLVFDKHGGFYFTDLGKEYHRYKEKSGLYYAKPDGSLISELFYGSIGLNGVCLSPDEQTVYAAETVTARLLAWPITAPGKVENEFLGGACVCTQPGRVFFDSMAMQANGDACVATILNGGITTITPQGVSTHTSFPDMIVTNICFGGADMRDAFITLSGTGKLIKARWPQPGLKLNFSGW